MINEAIILAGGSGTRLRTEINGVPKSMVKITEKPFLEILIETFHRKGIEHFILSLGYMPDVIIKHFQNRYRNIKISFCVEKEKLDTGGAIRLALESLHSDKALIMNGDSFFDVDLDAANTIFDKYRAPIIFGKEVDDVSRYGCFECQNNIVYSYAEKKYVGKGCINAGLYVFPKDLLADFEPNLPFSIEKDFFAKITKQMNVRLIASDNYFIDIGIPEDYRRAQKELLPYIQQLKDHENSAFL